MKKTGKSDDHGFKKWKNYSKSIQGYDELRSRPDAIFARMIAEQEMESGNEVISEENKEDKEQLQIDDPEVDFVTENVIRSR